MKKIIFIFLSLLISFFFFVSISFGANCNYKDGDISKNLENCLEGTPLVKGPNNAKIDDGLNKYITGWTNNIALYLGVFAVLGIALGSFMLVTSAGEEDKLKRGKDIIKWSIIGFVGVITTALIINLVIRIMYSSALNSSIMLGI